MTGLVEPMSDRCGEELRPVERGAGVTTLRCPVHGVQAHVTDLESEQAWGQFPLNWFDFESLAAQRVYERAREDR